MIIDHSGGDRGKYQGVVWYRKHFKLPAAASGSKVFIEFEGMRQSGDIYLTVCHSACMRTGLRDTAST